MQDRDTGQHTERTSRTWVAVFCVVAVFLLWTLLIFFTVGVKWPPAWDFGAIPDVPGLSVYSTHPPEARQPQRAGSLHENDELAPQHVKDPPKKYLTKEQNE